MRILPELGVLSTRVGMEVIAHIGIRIDVEVHGLLGCIARARETTRETSPFFQNPGEGKTYFAGVCSRSNDVDNCLHRWAVAVSDESDEVVHE
jgi:hypothetical protein